MSGTHYGRVKEQYQKSMDGIGHATVLRGGVLSGGRQCLGEAAVLWKQAEWGDGEKEKMMCCWWGHQVRKLNIWSIQPNTNFSSTLHLPAFLCASLPCLALDLLHVGAAASTEIIVCSQIMFQTLVGDGLWLCHWVLKVIWCVIPFSSYKLPLTDTPSFLILLSVSSHCFMKVSFHHISSCTFSNERSSWLQLNCMTSLSHRYDYLFNLLSWHWLFSCLF